MSNRKPDYVRYLPEFLGILAVIGGIATGGAVVNEVMNDASSEHTFDPADARDQVAGCLADGTEPTEQEIVAAEAWLADFAVPTGADKVEISSAYADNSLFTDPTIECEQVERMFNLPDLD